jgi:oxalate---CoA ligase
MSSDLTFGAVLHRHAAVRPESAALLAPGRAPMTYAELWRQTAAFGEMLRTRRVARGQRVGLALPNGPEAASAFIGITTHAACVPLNPQFRQAEFTRQLASTRVELLVAGPDVPTELEAAARQLRIPIVHVTPIPQGPAGALDHGCGTSGRTDAQTASECSTPTDVGMLIPTSGTSGQQKNVALTHANLVASSANLASHLALVPSDRCLNVMPLFHSHALRGALLTSLYAGASVICTPGFSSEQIVSWLHDLRPTWYTAVPTIHQAVLAAFNALPQAVRPPSLRFVRSTSSALPPATLVQLESVLHAPVVESYGMTECSVICINPLPPGERRIGSVGQPTRVDFRIVDDAGNECPNGVVGQIVIRGPRVIEGYDDNEPANAAAFHDGWFRTGDLARRDADGYVFITGRAGEIVNRGGEKIAPREVDDALLEHAAVSQAVAFGVPHATLGQDLVAAVVLRPSCEVSEQALREHLFSRLVGAKIPTSILVLDEIPKGPIGKVQRTQLHLLLADRLRRAHVEPRTPIEASVAAAFRDVLRSERVGVFDNFFALGGDSLSGARVVARIGRDHAVTLPATALFLHPTVAELAAQLEAIGSAAQRRRDEIEAEVAALSEEEVLQLLAQEEAAAALRPLA